VTREEFIHCANTWAQQRVPFLFLIDFEIQKPWIRRLAEVDDAEVLFDFPHGRNTPRVQAPPVFLQPHPVPRASYQTKFELVMAHLLRGDSFLTNLTIKTPVETNHTLRQLFQAGVSPYKMCFRDEFVFFSPECFVTVADGKIYSFPMKGTSEVAHDPDGQLILADPKEMAEHVTIVDLIRNDLSTVANTVEVSRFRYLNKIVTPGRSLWQVSSEIVGSVSDEFSSRMGDLLIALLPAGSVSGAPKKKTMEIIARAEGECRGYYTGVAGVFDGHTLDSAVVIRYVEKQNHKLFYRSGGGITTRSQWEREYAEALAKIYVPIH
jgi:para-aminobenzoate synthetase component 1